MKNKFLLVITFVLVHGISMGQNLVGLWQIIEAKMDDQTMTPDGKWIQFNADSTQESGNGWSQHSIGTFTFNEQTKMISVFNSNGITDTYPPFLVSMEGEEMLWSRIEDGHAVQARLRRIEKIPAKKADLLLGLWVLEKPSTDEIPKELFVRWDQQYVAYFRAKKVHGSYYVHAHRPELNLIPLNDELPRERWKFEVNMQVLRLEFKGKSYTYKRSNTLPN